MSALAVLGLATLGSVGAMAGAAGIAAASFLYIAFGDLLPRIHNQTDRLQRQWQYLMLVLGIASIAPIRMHHG